jgi:hypothetical protein
MFTTEEYIPQSRKTGSQHYDALERLQLGSNSFSPSNNIKIIQIAIEKKVRLTEGHTSSTLSNSVRAHDQV